MSHGLRIVASVAAVIVFGSSGRLDADRQSRARASEAASAGARASYQVPAGTALLVTLHGPLDTASSTVGDQIEARLWSPVVQEGTELIPTGSLVVGRLVDVARATEKTPAAFTIAFSVVEHAETRSRATLASRRLVLHATAAAEAETAPARGKRKRWSRTVVPAGTSIVVTTSEPLTVRIPR